MRPPARLRRPAPTAVVLAMAVALVVAIVLAGCSGGRSAGSASDRAEIARIDERGIGLPRPQRVGPPGPSTTPTSSTVSSAVPREPGVAVERDDDLAVADDVLARYDRALTSIAGDPLTTTVEGHPAMRAWEDAVVTTSSFSAAMLAELRDRALLDGTVVLPGADGTSYSHRALRATRASDAISFTWCGHSPGIGVDVASRAVVDDEVAVSHGTGELRSDGTGWRLVTLDALDVEVRAPGTPDPCPAEAAAAKERR